MTEADKAFLDSAYVLDDPAATQDFYGAWAKTYEREIKANGYATPDRCADDLAAQVEDPSEPLLDLGCGTGLSGEALRARGFTTVDGTDFSVDMLDHARGKTGVYRDLTLGDLAHPLPATPGQYANMAAVGVFSPGHAPPQTMEMVIHRLPVGGCFVFSLNDHTMEDPSYVAKVDELVATGEVAIASMAYGPHLPGRDLKAMVYVLRRLV